MSAKRLVRRRRVDAAIVVFVLIGVVWNAFWFYRISLDDSSCGEGCLGVLADFVFWIPGAAILGGGTLAALPYCRARIIKHCRPQLLAVVFLAAMQVALVIGILRIAFAS